MTDLKTLSKLALRTESIVPDLNGQIANLKDMLNLVSIAGNILDQAKRKVFYGEKGEYKVEKLNALSEDLLNVDAFSFTAGEVQANEAEQKFEINTRVVHGIVGIITEAAELAEALVKYLQTGEIDVVNLFEECADVAWYQCVLQDELNISNEAILHFLIAKLSARYGDKFTDSAAVLRDIGSEREVMERFLKDQNLSV